MGASSMIPRVSRSRSFVGRCKAGAPSMRTRAIRAASRKESSSSGGKALYARNNAVADSYLFAWSTWPEEAATDGPAKPRRQALVWRANYHPDGGQLFCPLHGERFVVPLAMPGDDVRPERFVTFWCDGSRGLYIHPNVWHGAIAPLDDHAELLDRQGRVHARVSVDFAKEFGCYLAVPMHRPVA